jgi:hypothetical protein
MTDQAPNQPAAPPSWVQPANPQFHPASPPPLPPPAGPVRPVYRRGWFLFLAGGLVGLFFGVAIGNSGSSPNRASTATTGRPAVSTAATPMPTDPPETTAVAQPRRRDFELTVKTLSKQCFGSAGCNLTYRIEVGYDGPPLDPSNTYEVVYEVRGGEDGPQINTLTVEGDQSSVDSEESISTNSSARKLTAVVTSVDLVS